MADETIVTEPIEGEKEESALYPWRAIWDCLSREGRAALLLAYELGKTGDSFSVTASDFKPLFVGLEALGFVEAGEVGIAGETDPLSHPYFLKGAGYYLIKWTLAEKALIVKVEVAQEIST